MTTEEFKAIIRNEATRRGCSPATLCRKAVGNNRLYRTLVNNGSCTLDVAERFMGYLKDNPLKSEERPA